MLHAAVESHVAAACAEGVSPGRCGRCCRSWRPWLRSLLLDQRSIGAPLLAQPALHRGQQLLSAQLGHLRQGSACKLCAVSTVDASARLALAPALPV